MQIQHRKARNPADWKQQHFEFEACHCITVQHVEVSVCCAFYFSNTPKMSFTVVATIHDSIAMKTWENNGLWQISLVGVIATILICEFRKLLPSSGEAQPCFHRIAWGILYWYLIYLSLSLTKMSPKKYFIIYTPVPVGPCCSRTTHDFLGLRINVILT